MVGGPRRPDRARLWVITDYRKRRRTRRPTTILKFSVAVETVVMEISACSFVLEKGEMHLKVI